MPTNAKKDGGTGPCPFASACIVRHKFHQLVVSKTHENAVAAVSTTARAALEARAATAATAATDAANVRRRRKKPRTQVPVGALGKSLQKSTAEKADDACATVFFAELSIGRRPHASTTPHHQRPPRDSDYLEESAPETGTLGDRKDQPNTHTPPSGDSATPPSGASETNKTTAPCLKGKAGLSCESQQRYTPRGPFQSAISLNLDSIRTQPDGFFADLHGLKANVFLFQDYRRNRGGKRSFLLDALQNSSGAGADTAPRSRTPSNPRAGDCTGEPWYWSTPTTRGG